MPRGVLGTLGITVFKLGKKKIIQKKKFRGETIGKTSARYTLFGSVRQSKARKWGKGQL